ELVAGVGASVEDVVALLLDGRRVGHQDRHRGQEHTGGLASGARAHETPYGLCEEHGGGGGGRVHAHCQSRHVHALGDHAHRDHPPVLGGGELFDSLPGPDVVGQHHGRCLPADLLQRG